MSEVPSIIFIVPYRNRELQQELFRRQMSYVLESHKSYEIFFVHQKDTRTFNRGAMKNIGFMVMKQKYPDDYKKITFVFNDIDTMPYTSDTFQYETIKGTIKHFYGFKQALGGIVSINGEDFESMSGFPNYWSWGYEDNELQRRAIFLNIIIDRNNFYPIMDRNVIHLQDGFIREIDKGEKHRFLMKQNPQKDGLNDIHNLEYCIEDDMVHVTKFDTSFLENPDSKIKHDLRHDLGVRNLKMPLRF